MVSVGRREQTKNGEASLVKHATPGSGRTKEGGSYEKGGRVAVRGEGPCDRNCDQVLARTQPQPSITREGYSGGKFLDLFLLPPFISYQSTNSKPVWKPEVKGPRWHHL